MVVQHDVRASRAAMVDPFPSLTEEMRRMAVRSPAAKPQPEPIVVLGGFATIPFRPQGKP